MKKHRKLVALLIALTFLFSVAAPAMAASDVSAAEKAAGKLEALGIIEGYPDGTFGLDREITRAEFAKVAVIASGHGDAGEILKATPSKFSDVKTNEWYTGWINLAASQGYVKGYPDGTFRPNDKITNAEVVTVLLRLLGYNDNLPGDWPTNYIVKAVALEITKGISFDAKGFAVRGAVFMMADKTLDTEMVKWVSDDQAFEGKDEKLIAKSFEGQMEDGLVTDITWDSKGYMSADIDGSSIEVSEDVIVTGGPDLLALLGSKVDYVLNDDDEIVYASVKDTKTVSDDELTFSGNGTLTIDDKKYSMIDDFVLVSYPGNLTDAQIDAMNDGGDIDADKIVVVLDKKNNAEAAFIYEYSAADIIDEIDGDKLFGKERTNFEYDEDDNVVIVKNGAVASFKDLAEGDLFYLLEDVRGLDSLLIASDVTVEGTFEAASGTWGKVTVDGTKYDVDSDALVSDNEGKDFDAYGDVFAKEMIDKDITLLLSPIGKVAFAISGAKAEGEDLYGIVMTVNADVWGTKKAKILTASGSKVIFEVKYSSTDTEAWDTLIGLGANDYNLVLYRLNDDGLIKYVKAIKTIATDRFGQAADEDGNRIKLDDTWYRVADDAIFFVKDGDDDADWATAKWGAFADAIPTTVNTPYLWVAFDGNKVVAVRYAAEIEDSNNYGVIADSGYNTKGFYYDVFVGGEKTRYNIVSGESKSYAKGTFVVFDLVDGKIDITTATAKGDLTKTEVTKVGSGYIQAGSYYDIDEETMIVDVRESTPKLVSRVARGDYVYIDSNATDTEDGILDIVVIVKAPTVTPPSVITGVTLTVTEGGVATVAGDVYSDGGNNRWAISVFDSNGTAIGSKSDVATQAHEDGAGLVIDLSSTIGADKEGTYTFKLFNTADPTLIVKEVSRYIVTPAP